MGGSGPFLCSLFLSFCRRAKGGQRPFPLSRSNSCNHNHQVGRDVGDTGQEVRGQAGEMALGEVTRWEDLENVSRLEERKAETKP